MNEPEVLKPLDIRDVQWDNENLQDRNCPVCSSSSSRDWAIRPDSLKVQLCGECGLLFVSPAPVESALNTFYSTYDNLPANRAAADEVVIRKELLAVDPLTDVRIQTLSGHLDISKSSVLDVGCGRGDFLFLMKQLGCSVTGIDPDKAAITIAKNIGIDNTLCGYLEDGKLSAKFDLIVLNDLVEHPLKPMELLTTCLSLLKDNGMILIWTPNGDRVYSDQERITFRVDLEHMQYFTTEAIKSISTCLPLKIIHFEILGHSSLSGITASEQPASIQLSSALRGVARLFPGYSKLKQLRAKLQGNDLRQGNYQMFTLLRKEK
ncbi:MAG: 2-polyprenyl-3-methyl-5-hydroxy-6-metoxy-1,4-benzoquinol methylase [Patiriisocius sp.]|jgi:2-polyprenyl-3-methyl-5-hydroxy-6-metoxy-1,4-benzoquinol methylase